MTDADGATSRPALATRREVLAAVGTGVAAITSGETSEPFLPGTYGAGYYGFDDYGVSK